MVKSASFFVLGLLPGYIRLHFYTRFLFALRFTLVYDDKILRILLLFPFPSISICICLLAGIPPGMYFILYLEFGVESLVCPLELYEYVQFKLHISTVLFFCAGFCC
jgi:hypothetical protein